MVDFEIGNRLKSAREKLNLSQNQLANILNIHKQSVSRYETGERNITQKMITKLVELLNINPTWLLTGQGNMFLESDHLLGSVAPNCHDNVAVYSKGALNTLQIPVVGKVKAGTLSFEAEDIIDYIRIPGGGGIPPNAFALIVKGDSMSPTIKDSDYVIIAKTEDIISGDIVLIHDVWGDVCIKRFSLFFLKPPY